jgi:hypothetical protein
MPLAGGQAFAESLDDLLAQEQIRIYIYDGNGMGHQSNSFLLGRWLRSKGYSGELQFVFRDGENRRIGPAELVNSQKVNRLYPAYAPEGPAEQYIEEDRVRIIRLEGEESEQPLEKIKYLLSGGVDPLSNDQNFLNQIGLHEFYEYMVVINPWKWHSVGYVQRSQDRQTIGISRRGGSETLGIDYGAPIEIPDYHYPSMSDTREQTRELLFSWLDRGFNVWPFYGHFYDAPIALGNINLAYKESIASRYSWDPPSPTIVIPIFIPFSDREEFIRGFNDEDQQKIRAIDGIKENDINFVLVDSVSPSEFESIFLSERFPLVFASGQNSVNLMASRGQTFLQNQLNISSDPYQENSLEGDELALLRMGATRDLNDSYLRNRNRKNYLNEFLKEIIQNPRRYRVWSLRASDEFIGESGAFEKTLSGVLPHIDSINSCNSHFL